VPKDGEGRVTNALVSDAQPFGWGTAYEAAGCRITCSSGFFSSPGVG